MARDKGIRARFGWGILGSGVVLAAAIAWLASHRIDGMLEEALAQQAQVYADVLVEQANLATSPGEIERQVFAVGRHREILELVLVGGRRQVVLGATRRSLVGAGLDDLLAAQLTTLLEDGRLRPGAELRHEGHVYEAVLPFVFTNLGLPDLFEQPGAVVIRLDGTQPMQQATTGKRLLVAALLGVVGSAFAVFVFLTRRHILQPVQDLQRVMRARRDGDHAARPARMPNTDLQALADSLSDLLDSLDRSQALQHAVVEGASDAIVTIDVHGVIRQWNGGATKMFGIPAEQAIGRNIKLILPSPHAEAHDGYIRRYLDTGVARLLGFPREVDARRLDGSMIPVGLAVNEARVGDERLFVGILRDMSEERARRRELQQAKDAADAAAVAKSAFLANMSHEIRTPLTAILGYAEELEREDLGVADRLESSRVIRRNGEHLLTIINDILDLSKIEAGRMTIERLPVRIDAIASDVVALMMPRARAKGLELDLVLCSAMPESVATDPTRVRQILINLIGNAIKFTSVGKVTVAIEARFDAEQLTISVVDTGIGIPVDKLSQLFGRFVQADSSTTRFFGGTGLGLHISMRLAQMLGGELVAESTEDVGSRFTLTLATGRMLRAATGDQATAVHPRQKRLVVPKLQGRVLLAEDGVDNQRLIGRILGDTGLDVTIVGDGLAAVDAATSTAFDLVVMDMQMPVMDGLTAVRALREAGQTMPIVALTANVMNEDRDRALAAGCTHFATKPVDRRALYAVLQGSLAPTATAPSAG